MHRASKLGPEYNCQRCDLRYKDLKAEPYQCPTCPLMRSYVRMIDGDRSKKGNLVTRGIVHEVYKRLCNGEEVWPNAEFSLKQILHAFFLIYGRLLDSKFAVYEHWDETTAELCRIVISEKNTAEYALSWKPEGSSSGRPR